MTITPDLKPRNLSVVLRPRRFSEVVGQKELLDKLRQLFAERTPLGVMFVGEPGTGKTTIAKIIALSLQCQHAPFGEPCDDCLAKEGSFEILERNCAMLSKAEDARELVTELQCLPRLGDYRVVILDEAQQTTPTAQNIFLKPFEDENSCNVFLIGTSDPTKIIDAVKRRFVIFNVPGQGPEGVETLVRNTIGVASDENPYAVHVNELIQELLKAEVTSSGLIVMAVEQLLAGVSPANAVLVKGGSTIDYYALCYAAGQGKWDDCRTILTKAVPADGEIIKMRMSAYFRKKLLDTPINSKRAGLLIQFIHELADHSVVETGLQLSAVVASIAMICQIVQQERIKSQTPPESRAA